MNDKIKYYGGFIIALLGWASFAVLPPIVGLFMWGVGTLIMLSSDPDVVLGNKKKAKK